MKLLPLIIIAQFGVPFPSAPPPNPALETPAAVEVVETQAPSQEVPEAHSSTTEEIESTAPGVIENQEEIESTAPGVIEENPEDPPLTEQIPEGLGDKVETGIGSKFGQGYLATQKVANDLNFGMENLWANLFAPGSIYSQIQKALIPFTMLGVSIWVLYLVKEAGENGFWSDEAKKRLLWVLLVGLLVGNDGKFLGQVIQVMNRLVLNVNNLALDASFNGVSNRQAIREAQLQMQRSAIQSALGEECLTKKDPVDLENCQDTISQRSLEILKQNNSGILDQVGKAGGALRQTGVTIATAKANGATIAVLTAVSTGFYIIVRISLLVWASSAPLWVSITLFPINTRGVNIFLLGFWGIGNVIVSYTIIHGTIAWLLATTVGLTPLLFALVGGVFAPIGAIIIAAGSSVGLIAGMSGGAVKFGGKALLGGGA